MHDGGLATTTYYGITKLTNSTTSTSTSTAATPASVKSAYDLANTANTGLTLKADAQDLEDHINEVVTNEDGTTTEITNKLHITATERTAWNNKAPKNHKSTDTTYGVGDNDEYGHLKLSDSTSSALSTDGGTAATPKAVKTVADNLTNLSTNLSNNYYTKTAANAAFDAKGSASSAQTAATNAAKTYTDNQISALIGEASTGYQTLEEIEEKITSNDGDIADLNANFSNYYTKTAANAAFDAKGSASNAQTAATNAAKSYTDTAIANLINGAPEDLNTLKELADALAGDDSAIADINAALSTKANAEDLTKHINETDGKGKLHITSAERTK